MWMMRGRPAGTCPSIANCAPGRRLSRSVLHAGICRGSDAAADPPLQLRCRHHLLGYSGDPPRARPFGAVRSRRRAAARPHGHAGQGRHAGLEGRLLQIGAGLRGIAPRAPRARSQDRADRLLRRAVDGRDLHGGRTGHARPGAGADDGLSPPRGVFEDHRRAGRELDPVSAGTAQGRRRRAADFRHLGRRAAAARIPALVGRADPADRRRRAPGRHPTRRSSAFPAAPARSCRDMSRPPASMPSASTGRPSRR